MADQKKIIPSGNAELDSKLGGGLPAGSLILVEGNSGSGKSVLSQQILYGAVKGGFSAATFTSENTVKSLISQMQSIDMDVLDFLLMGRLRVYPMALSRFGSDAPARLLEALRQQKERDLVVVDSFTSAIARGTGDQPILKFFEECKKLCGKGVTIMVTLHAQAVGGDLVNPLRSMCDAHIVLRSEQDGQRLVKILEVAKIRGAGSSTGAIVGFDVEPGWGMRVIPISKARG